MNILDAAYHTVHDYKGGANALAPRMGIKSPAVLNSKAARLRHIQTFTGHLPQRRAGDGVMNSTGAAPAGLPGAG